MILREYKGVIGLTVALLRSRYNLTIVEILLNP